MAAVMNYLGWGRKAAAVIETRDIQPKLSTSKNEPVRALPASWYNSPNMFQMERRAIFSKKWMLITHKMRLPNVGNSLDFDIVSYSFSLQREQDNVIRGFLKVGDQGISKVDEGSDSGYEEMETFSMAKDGLSPIHVKVDVNGFIWVNLDASEDPEPWEKDFGNSDVQERFAPFDFDDYYLDHSYSVDGPYNWKILADNFNECYHCPTAHPDIPTLADITTHDVDPVDAYIKHQSEPTQEQQEKGLAIASTYYFPNVSVSILKNFIMLQRFLPKGPGSSTMEYQIFRNKSSTEEDFHLISDLYARVVSEDKILCELSQKNLNAGVFVNGLMHPHLEKGPLYFQQVNREVIHAHYKMEQEAQQQIWPAQRAG